MATIIVYVNEGAEVIHKKVEEIVVDTRQGKLWFDAIVEGLVDDKGQPLPVEKRAFVYPLSSFFCMTILGLAKMTFEVATP